MNNAISASLLFIFSASAHADIVCKFQTKMGEAKVSIATNLVAVSGAALAEPELFSQLSFSYDGHMTSLITAPGLSLSYENWYGCIHNAHLTTNLRSGTHLIESVAVGQCSGGSTPDSVCGLFVGQTED